jgi:hypothetical protein
LKESTLAFPFYAADWLGDEQIMAMSSAERGVYITLLAFVCRDGNLPNDSNVLARLVGEPHDIFKKVWLKILPFFVEQEDGRLVSSFLEKGRKRAAVSCVLPLLPADVNFGDIEPDVACYVANAAAGNKSGKIFPGRILSLRRDLFRVLEEVQDRDAFAYGLRAANSRNAVNPNYVKAAALTKKNNSQPSLLRIPSLQYRQGSGPPQ